MSPMIGPLIERIRVLEEELEVELVARRAELKFSIEKGWVIFDKEVVRSQKKLKTALLTYLVGTRPLMVLTAPFIYAVIIPLLLLDLLVSLYQAVCFPVYGIAKVRRGEYFVFDRSRLAYLNAIEKLNCAYCSYGTGLIAYVREITARSEQYWCPIKHARRVIGSHRRYPDFVDFGDAESYRKRLEDLRERLRDTPGP